MEKLRWKYLFKSNRRIMVECFLAAFGSIWLIIECCSALSSKFKYLIDLLDPWLLVGTSIASSAFSIYKALPQMSYIKTFKSVKTSISLKVGDLLDEKENIVIGSSDYFDFNYNTTLGVSLKSQMISKLFGNDVNYINNLVQQSLVEIEEIAELNEEKPYGNKLRYPIGTVAILPQGNRRIFTVVLTNLNYIGNDKHTQSDPVLLNKALISLWEKIKVEGRKKKFSLPVLGAGLANVNLSYLLIIQSIILSYAIYSRSSNISSEMSIIISPKDYNPNDFEEAVQFLNSLQI